MSKSTVETIARVLKVLVTVTFVCNLIALPLVPGLVLIGGEGGVPTLLEVTAESGAPGPLIFLAVCWQALWRVWREPYSAMLALFLLFSGVCTAVILWQGRRVLDTILRGEPFSLENAVSLWRAAVSSFVISLAALVRLVFSLCWYRSLAPLLTYNALFVPIFAMAGLLCLVMSALFRQAAEMKAENDLTI